MNVLVIAAHPDDELLGCGGTIAKHVDDGDTVTILILGEGITSRAKKRNAADEKDLKRLHNGAKRVAEFLGVSEVFIEDFPDNRFDSVDLLDIIKIIEDVKEDVNPETIYTHHPYDLNIDHRITYMATMTAFRPLPKSEVKMICTFETPSATHWSGPFSHMAFIPNYFIDISSTLDRKIEAMNFYNDEMREFPHPRSVEAVRNLAKTRGAEVGLNAAEAFWIVRFTRT